MIYESIYTSSDKNFVSGRVGFSTIAHTEGASSHLIQRLEYLSLYPRRNSEEDKKFTPIVHFHILLPMGAKIYHVLSRIVDCGFDYTGRTNYLAHHFVLTEDELPDCGPAAFLANAPFLDRWNSAPRYLAPRASNFVRNVSTTSLSSCPLWKQWSGDPYWSLALLEKIKQNLKTYIAVNENVPLLRLYDEAISLLVPEDRWKVSFCTCFLKFPVDIFCSWQGIFKESSGLDRGLVSNGMLLDLTKPLDPYPNRSLELKNGTLRLDSSVLDATQNHSNKTIPPKTSSFYDAPIPLTQSARLDFSALEERRLLKKEADRNEVNPFGGMFSDDLDEYEAMKLDDVSAGNNRQNPLPTYGQKQFDQLKTTPLRLKRTKKTLWKSVLYSVALFLWGAIIFVLFVVLLSFFVSCRGRSVAEIDRSAWRQGAAIRVLPSSSEKKKTNFYILFERSPFLGDYIWR